MSARRERSRASSEGPTLDQVAELATVLREHLDDLSDAVHREITASMPELDGDLGLSDLLRASIQSHVSMVLEVAQHDIALAEVRAPATSIEYARRLAQRGIAPTR